MGDTKTIYLIRHGQSSHNADKTLYYSEKKFDHEVALTEKGLGQAVECGKRLAKKIQGPFTTFVSPYLRARQTLENILPEISRPPTVNLVDGRLREQEWNFFNSEEELTAARAERIQQGKLQYRFRNGESGHDVVARVSAFFNQLRLDWVLGNRDDEIVIVCHEVTCRAFVMLALDGDAEVFDRLESDNCQIHVLKAGPKLLFGKKAPRLI